MGIAFVQAHGYRCIDDTRRPPWVTWMLRGKVRGGDMRSCGVLSLRWLANLLRLRKPRRHPAHEYVVYQSAVSQVQLERSMEIKRSASEGFQGWREPILRLSKCGLPQPLTHLAHVTHQTVFWGISICSACISKCLDVTLARISPLVQRQSQVAYRCTRDVILFRSGGDGVVSVHEEN